VKGTVRKFSTERGFGFIEPDDGSGDIFIHIKSIKGREQGSHPNVGARVEYEMITAADGRIQAVGVKILGDDYA
jgi:CspA family cold shock protein